MTEGKVHEGEAHILVAFEWAARDIVSARTKKVDAIIPISSMKPGPMTYTLASLGIPMYIAYENLSHKGATRIP